MMMARLKAFLETSENRLPTVTGNGTNINYVG